MGGRDFYHRPSGVDNVRFAVWDGSSQVGGGRRDLFLELEIGFWGALVVYPERRARWVGPSMV